jgi:cytochrome c nitrite reductase small subunit
MKIPIIVSILAILAIVVVGLYVTDFTAYLGNNPATCNNCHVMDYVYEGWYHAGHQEWTTCNECHTPHAFIPKYITKAKSGYHHVTAFVFGDIPDAIRAKDESRAIVQENCIRCHQEAVSNINMDLLYEDQLDNQVLVSSVEESGGERYCFECHRSAAHGDRGLSILPYKHSEDD